MTKAETDVIINTEKQKRGDIKMETKLVWVSVKDTQVTLQRLTSEQIIIAKNNGFTIRDLKTWEKI